MKLHITSSHMKVYEGMLCISFGQLQQSEAIVSLPVNTPLQIVNRYWSLTVRL